MLADGRLLRHRLRKDKKREKVMINIAAMTVDALSDCNVTTVSPDNGFTTSLDLEVKIDEFEIE